MKETIPRVVEAMKRAQDETGEAKLFSANITADDPFEMIARGEPGPLAAEFGLDRFREGRFIDESVAAGVAH